ncbi:MAG: hypothetical protein QXM75_03065 [Candidatus Diapherotrites archaeon]
MSEKDESKKSFWTTKKILFIFLIVVGIIIGALLQHYIIEPLISNKITEKLKTCEAENLELHSLLNKCNQMQKQ